MFTGFETQTLRSLPSNSHAFCEGRVSMTPTIVLISGPVASGKTTLAEGLCTRSSGKRFSTRDLLMRRLGNGGPVDRAQLQKIGGQLDDASGGTWLRDELWKEMYEAEDLELAVIDAVRVLPQIEALRSAFGKRVIHIHLTAPEDVLAARYEDRRRMSELVEAATYAEVRQDPTESKVDELRDDADILIDTDRSSPSDILTRALARLGLLDASHEPCVDVVVGGEFGSEGKGNICFHIAPEYQVLIRVGGPNAGHKVYLPSGEQYAHHQLPSGTRHGTGELLIGPGAVLNVEKLLKEIAECEVDAKRLAIDARAMTISSADIESESDLEERIGSTRQGVGAATARRILRREDVILAGDVPELEPFLVDAGEYLEAAYRSGKKLLLEGTQGTGLSLFHGSYPHVTSRDTTVSGCLAEAGIPPRRVRKVILVCRTLPIRVQDPPAEGRSSGRLTQELSWTDVERRAGFREGELQASERTTTTNKERRVGEFEWDLLRRAALLNAPTDIALTFVDYVDKRNEGARRFDQLTPETIGFIEEIEMVAGAPVTLISTRFHPQRSIIDRRSW